jgi:hypothetical protein
VRGLLVGVLDRAEERIDLPLVGGGVLQDAGDDAALVLGGDRGMLAGAERHVEQAGLDHRGEVEQPLGEVGRPDVGDRQPRPVEDRCKGHAQQSHNRTCGLDSSREGMMADFPLGSYVRLVDYTARLFRPGKATISAELAGIFDRLGTNARSWQVKMKKLRASRLLGRVFAASQTKLQEIAERLHVRYVVNLARCPAR